MLINLEGVKILVGVKKAKISRRNLFVFKSDNLYCFSSSDLN